MSMNKLKNRNLIMWLIFYILAPFGIPLLFATLGVIFSINKLIAFSLVLYIYSLPACVIGAIVMLTLLIIKKFKK
jgi:hypothetical protein